MFITTVEKSCGKTMRGLLLLKKCHGRKQWCVFVTTEKKSWGRTMSVFITTVWGCSLLLKKSHEGKQLGCLLQLKCFHEGKQWVCLLLL